MSSMRAVLYTVGDGQGVIRLIQTPAPIPGAARILVRVHAAGLNRADILQRRGRYAAPPGWPADIPGLEYAGVVETLGPEVTRWRVGDRVMGLVGGGAQAEFVVVHQDEAIAIPAGMSFTDAAAIPEAFLTAWDALATRGRLKAGERVLFHAVGSGVGTAGVQLARWLGATTVGTSRSAAKLENARALGLDEAIDTSSRGFREQLRAPLDVIVDVLGGPAFGENLQALNPKGRLVLLGFLQGPKVEGTLEPILRKRLEVIGSVMRTRTLEERVPLVRDFSERVLPGFAGDPPALRPIVGSVYPMTAVADAHQEMETDRNFGKIVLEW